MEVRLNILQMQQFRIIAQYQSITQAAEALYITSSALSKTLKNIESELNCSFFDRIGRKIVLNQNGVELLSYIDRILDDYDAMIHRFRNQPKNPNAAIILCDLGENILDKCITAFSQKYPYIRIKKEDVSFEKSLELLLAQKADIIFTDHLSLAKHPQEIASQHIESTFLFKNNLFLAVPPDSQYATLKEINLKQLRHENFVEIKGDLQDVIKTAPLIEQLQNSEDFKINFAYHYDLDYAYKNLFFTPHLYLSDSLHISYYTDSRKYKRFIKLSNPTAYQDIFICHRPDDPHVAVLADVLKKTFLDIFISDPDELLS